MKKIFFLLILLLVGLSACKKDKEKSNFDMSKITFDDSSFIYDGSAKSIKIKGDLPDGLSVSYTGNEVINVGTYTVTANFTTTLDNYNTPSDLSATLTINKKQLTTPTLSGVYYYDGSEQTAVLNDFDSNTMNVSGNKKTNAGTTNIIVSLKDTTNYEFTTNNTSISWTILEHNYSSAWTNNETSHYHACTDSGYESLKADEGNHSYGNWTVVTAPTYLAKGLEKRVCSVCGYIETREIDKLEYKYGSKVNSLSIINEPTKLSYCIGDQIDYTGLVVKAVLENGSYSDEISNSELSFSSVDTSTIGTKIITISNTIDNELHQVNFEITVNLNLFQQDGFITLDINEDGTYSYTQKNYYGKSFCNEIISSTWEYIDGIYYLHNSNEIINEYIEFGNKIEKIEKNYFYGLDYFRLIKITDGLYAFYSDSLYLFQDPTFVPSAYIDTRLIKTISSKDFGYDFDYIVNEGRFDYGYGCIYDIYSNGTYIEYDLSKYDFSDYDITDYTEDGIYQLNINDKGDYYVIDVLIENLNVLWEINTYKKSFSIQDYTTMDEIISDYGRIYDNDLERSVDLDDASITITNFPTNISIAGNYSFTITYKEISKDVSFDIYDDTVVTSISFFAEFSNDCIEKGTPFEDAFDVFLYNFGDDIVNDEYQVNGYDPNTLGIQLVTVTYGTISESICVFVYDESNGKTVVNIEDILVYDEDEGYCSIDYFLLDFINIFDTLKIYLSVEYADGTTDYIAFDMNCVKCDILTLSDYYCLRGLYEYKEDGISVYCEMNFATETYIDNSCSKK